MTMQKKLLPILGSILLVLNVGCADRGFSGTPSTQAAVERFDDDEPSAKGEVPMAIAYGGVLQFHYYDLAKSDENVMGVESLIGQPIMAKVHQKNGVRVDVGYPGLQSYFAVE